MFIEVPDIIMSYAITVLQKETFHHIPINLKESKCLPGHYQSVN